MRNCYPVRLQTILREEGQLTIYQNDAFELKRVYYIYGVPNNAERGHHAHKSLYQVMIAVVGSFQVTLKDGLTSVTYELNDPCDGLIIVPGIWRELSNFSMDAVCLVLASAVYDEADYIRDYKTFLEFKNGHSINS